MLIFVLRRLGQSLFLVFGAITIVFLVVRVVPGDPSALIVGAGATKAQLADVRANLGLDDPLWEQYVVHITEVLRGDFGESWRLGGSALDNTLNRLPASLLLALYALLFTILVGFPLGVLCARRAGSWLDSFISGFSLVGQALPSFWVGIMAILIFSRALDLVPATADGSFTSTLMPSVVLALPFIGWLARLVRGGVLEEMGKDYVRTARSKGLPERAVFNVHVLRNILIPVVTVLGLLMGNFLANAVIIEVVFSWPGIGSLMVESITNRDYQVVEACILTLTVAYIALNFLVDVTYFYLDPRLTPETA
jgi:peptide/nickel transport system permease protein